MCVVGKELITWPHMSPGFHNTSSHIIDMSPNQDGQSLLKCWQHKFRHISLLTRLVFFACSSFWSFWLALAKFFSKKTNIEFGFQKICQITILLKVTFDTKFIFDEISQVVRAKTPSKIVRSKCCNNIFFSYIMTRTRL